MSKQSKFEKWVEGTFYFEGGDWPDPKLIAAHILKVAEECSFDGYTNEGIKMRVVMLQDLENYINQEGGE